MYKRQGTGSGDEKCVDAVKQAISSPLLDTTIEGASHVIINISGAVALQEANEAVSYIQELTGEDTNIIFGVVDGGDDAGDTVQITVIATGLENDGTVSYTHLDVYKRQVLSLERMADLSDWIRMKMLLRQAQRD